MLPCQSCTDLTDIHIFLHSDIITVCWCWRKASPMIAEWWRKWHIWTSWSITNNSLAKHMLFWLGVFQRNCKNFLSGMFLLIKVCTIFEYDQLFNYCFQLINYCFQLNNYCFQLINYCFQLINYCFQLISYCFQLINYCFQLINYCFQLINYCSNWSIIVSTDQLLFSTDQLYCLYLYFH